MPRTLIGLAVAGALLVGCRFDQGGLSRGPDAATPEEPDPTGPDARPTIDAREPAPVDAAPICEEPLVDCPDGCVDVDTDDDNCGQCDRTCDKDERCDQGECVDAQSGGGGGH